MAARGPSRSRWESRRALVWLLEAWQAGGVTSQEVALPGQSTWKKGSLVAAQLHLRVKFIAGRQIDQSDYRLAGQLCFLNALKALPIYIYIYINLNLVHLQAWFVCFAYSLCLSFIFVFGQCTLYLDFHVASSDC